MNTKRIFLITLILMAFLATNAMAVTPPPTTLTNTSDVGCVQWNWVAGVGNVTDTYNISRTYDSTTVWFNGTTNAYIFWTGLAGESVTIAVFAYNTTYSELSTSITDTITVSMMFGKVVILIDAIVPLFGAIFDLIVALFPLIIGMAFLAGLSLLINKIFNKGLDFGKK